MPNVVFIFGTKLWWFKVYLYAGGVYVNFNSLLPTIFKMELKFILCYSHPQYNRPLISLKNSFPKFIIELHISKSRSGSAIYRLYISIICHIGNCHGYNSCRPKKTWISYCVWIIQQNEILLVLTIKHRNKWT